MSPFACAYCLHKMFTNQLVREICHLKLGASLFNYDLSCPNFADDMTLVSCYPSCLNFSCSLPISIQATGGISSVTPKYLWLPLVNFQLNTAKISKLETGRLGLYTQFCRIKDAAVRGEPPNNNFRKT